MGSQWNATGQHQIDSLTVSPNVLIDEKPLFLKEAHNIEQWNS